MLFHSTLRIYLYFGTMITAFGYWSDCSQQLMPTLQILPEIRQNASRKMGRRTGYGTEAVGAYTQPSLTAASEQADYSIKDSTIKLDLPNSRRNFKFIVRDPKEHARFKACGPPILSFLGDHRLKHARCKFIENTWKAFKAAPSPDEVEAESILEERHCQLLSRIQGFTETPLLLKRSQCFLNKLLSHDFQTSTPGWNSLRRASGDSLAMRKPFPSSRV